MEVPEGEAGGSRLDRRGDLTDAYVPSADVVAGLTLLWRRKFVIAAGTMAFGLITLFFGLRVTRVYEATTLLVVRDSTIRDGGAGTGWVAMARALVGAQSTAAQVIDELDLRGPDDSRLLGFTPGTLEVSAVPDTNLLEVTVRLESPDLAARTANRLAELAIGMNLILNRDETATNRDLLRAELETAQARLHDASTELLAFRNSSQIELARADVDALIGWRNDLIPLLADIEAERAQIASAEKELSGYDRILILRRSIDTSPAMLTAAQEVGGAETDLLSLELREETLDPAYQSLESQIVSSRTRLPFLEARFQKFREEVSARGDATALLGKLYDAELTLSNLQGEYSLAQRIHEDLAANYENARIQVASRRPQLQLIDAATPPSLPVRRGTLRKVAFACLAGLLATSLAVTAADYLTRSPRT